MQGTSDIDACLAVSRTIVTLQAEVGENAADDHRQAAGCGGYRRCIRVAGVQPRLTEQIASRRWSAGSCSVLSWRTHLSSGRRPERRGARRTLRRWLAAYRREAWPRWSAGPTPTGDAGGCRRSCRWSGRVQETGRHSGADRAVVTGSPYPQADAILASTRAAGRPLAQVPEADRPRGGAGAGGCGCSSPRTRHPRRPTAAGHHRLPSCCQVITLTACQVPSRIWHQASGLSAGTVRPLAGASPTGSSAVSCGSTGVIRPIAARVISRSPAERAL